MPSRFRQRAIVRSVGAGAQTSGFAPLPRGLHNAQSSLSASFLQWFDYVELESGQVQPRVTMTAFPTLMSAAQTARSALGYGWPAIKFSHYVIGYEAGGQLNNVGTWSRSGNQLTVNFVNMAGTASDTARAGASVGAACVLMGFTGAEAVWNAAGTINSTMTNGSSTSVTITVTTTAGTGTSGDAGGNVILAVTGNTYYAVAQALVSHPEYFLHKQGTSGRRVAWTTNYYKYNMDVQQSGWRDWSATDYYNNVYNLIGGCVGVFIDNYMDPRSDAINNNLYSGQTTLIDMNGDGTLDSITNSTVLANWRTGMAAYAQKFRSLGVTWTEGNYDSANGGGLPGAYLNSTNKVFIENVITTSQFSSLNTIYNACKGRLLTTPAGEDHVVLGIEPSAGWSDKEAIRFFIGQAWLWDKGMPRLMAVTMSGTPYVPDEFKVGAGSAIDSEPAAADANGLWKRRYENLYVVVNPTGSAANLDLTGTAWKRINGSDDPTVNSGGSAINGVVSIPAGKARFFIINDSGL
jgi:hypothetical protein